MCCQIVYKQFLDGLKIAAVILRNFHVSAQFLYSLEYTQNSHDPAITLIVSLVHDSVIMMYEAPCEAAMSSIP